MGDSVQSLKAGILEVGDILIVNKTDRAGSKELVADLRQMIDLSEHDNSDWIPKIIETIATDGTGLSALAAAIRHHFCILTRGSEFARRTLAIARSEVSALLTTELDSRIREQDRDPNLRAAIASVARRERTSLEVMQSLSFFG